ncbi:MAG TPA: YihY/virulence factor BrkB family protein [Thermoanaerobaculia bacterium]|nr:YihY/virulence factor BrkB family protein [Thermoanaerobaculia bacterium]
MKRRLQSTRGLWGPILRETFRAWIERDAFTQSAALAFFALFSLAPVLVLFAAGAGLLFDPAAVRHQIVGQFELLMGHEQALAVDAMLGHAAFEMSGVLARIIGVATFAIGTLAVFVQLQDSLNMMWDVAPKPGPLIRKLLWKRVISFALVLALGFVLVVSLVLSATIHALQSFAERFATLPSSVFETGNALVTYVLVTVLFAMLYRILPDVEIPWRDVWVGAILTALLLSVGKWAIGFYLGRSDLASAYGTAGSMIVLMFWVYYASLLVLLGAVFTRVQSRHFHEAHRRATAGARRVKVVEKKL